MLNFRCLIVVLISSLCLVSVTSFSTKPGLRYAGVKRIETYKSSVSENKSPTTLSIGDEIQKVTSKPKSNVLSKLKKFMIPALIAAPLFAFQHVAGASTLSQSVTSLSKSASDSGFLPSFLLIFISEIGDKTFFIAALLAAKYGKVISFIGSMSALGIMTVISTVLGQIFHAVPSSLTKGIPFDDYIAVAAFSYFGLKTLYDASQISIDDNTGLEEEKEEAEKSVSEINKRNNVLTLLFQIFSLVFAAEIGDRSFLSTIALSASLNPYAVTAGAIAAHATATGVAVVGGEILSKYLSEKVIGYIGGVLFLVFAVTTAIGLF